MAVVLFLMLPNRNGLSPAICGIGRPAMDDLRIADSDSPRSAERVVSKPHGIVSRRDARRGFFAGQTTM